ncbi:CpaD family pilus assembly protein [Sphingomonas sp. BN140010]|uniref:CpaD family pilus assembly protein n=1 Tax=Sphingomonas arvum TaxID=2992113 RepID=A0ABT3JDJ4_9SPHN|nr:CpaD family pilus assembly protein [Sphingomonas sp. BN140010]MCW3797153.1 CpaD family pilus assembly protein [Sphingomonas sp. BN140010]
MIKKFALLALAAASTGACGYTPKDQPQRGVLPVNVPVVSRSDYVIDLAASTGSLGPSEAGRLDGWFRGLQLGYGDAIYIDGPMAGSIRPEVAEVAGRYGMLVSNGAPVTAGALSDGAVRVVVTRSRAQVPGCPNWSEPALPNYQNRMLSNFGCGVNSNMAAMVANPEDLVHGRDPDGVTDPATATRAIDAYRTQAPTGKGGLQSVSTKSGG